MRQQLKPLEFGQKMLIDGEPAELFCVTTFTRSPIAGIRIYRFETLSGKLLRATHWPDGWIERITEERERAA